MNRFKDTEAIKTTPTKSLIRALVISMGLTFIIFAIVLSISICKYSNNLFIISFKSVCIPIFNISIIIGDANFDFSNGPIHG